MACNFNSVLKAANTCKENPAGVSSYCMVVPFANAVELEPEDNGPGKGNTVTGTGRVEIGIDEMAVLSRTLSNLDGNFLVFFPTGVKKDPTGGSSPVTEWLVVGNPQGDITWSRTTDTGAARGDDHGTTFSVSCDFQVYDTVKYYGEISQADAA